MLWLRQGLLTATVVLMLGAVFVAVTPFDDGSVRCGAPIAGAPTSVDSAPPEVVALGNCGDKGVTRLVYSTGLFVAALLATLTVLATWNLWSRPKPAAAGLASAPGTTPAPGLGPGSASASATAWAPAAAAPETVGSAEPVSPIEPAEAGSAPAPRPGSGSGVAPDLARPAEAAKPVAAGAAAAAESDAGLVPDPAGPAERAATTPPTD